MSQLHCNFEGCPNYIYSTHTCCSSCSLQFCDIHYIGFYKYKHKRIGGLLCILCITDGNIEHVYTYRNMRTGENMIMDEIIQVKNTGTLLTKGCKCS